ncbi:hypothetical protein QBC46DRAFT_350271 [Diplogelasinospora grovesii]|uniref:Glycosyltransferase 2 n=1 Tax=Diplogelasinospora grovesii TaxID=303347 RepID=A0AAN6S907_9PEZI|nr:hypothetical protein QBC46DRAFT_350271 [Diplogelasinospora grovesii]
MRLWGAGKMVSLFLSDEELGKKDDDHKKSALPTIRPGSSHGWNTAKVPPRKTLKRLAIALVVGLCIYLFIKNIPTDVPIRDHRRPTYTHPEDVSQPPVTTPKPMPQLKPIRPPEPPPQVDSKPKEEEKPKDDKSDLAPSNGGHKEYNGPVRFLNLAVSLHAISGTKGSWSTNKNILFAAGSLKSAATLLPMACQMGAELRSYVHFALMSRSEIDMDELRAVNGIDDSCQIIFHDARPDFPSTSTEKRLQNSVSRAMYHINVYMHPQAVLIDSSSAEERYFLDTMRVQAPNLEIPVIELPENAPKQLAWITKLDSSSLAAWNKINIDVLIHASPGASGSLIRLLKSLTAADFSSCSIPHLTIELPQKVDPPTAEFLRSFTWPPPHLPNPTNVKQLTLRHRIQRSSLTEEESSARFLESFWPTDPKHSHVLVLSPQAELSPHFFHYLKYAVLEYLHSNAARLQEWESRLLGISLDLPSTHLNASEPFAPPLGGGKEGGTPFLWQAPNSNAVLYMGQKWVELHGLVSRLLELQPTTTGPMFSVKLVSKRYPSWLEQALRLSLARGYWTLYPSQLMAGNLATVHNDLYKAPEEYEAELVENNKKKGVNEEVKLTKGGPATLLDSLLLSGSEVAINDMPMLSWDGTPTTLRGLDSDARDYANEFRRAVGGGDCGGMAAEDLIPKPGDVGDLFCVKDEL